MTDENKVIERIHSLTLWPGVDSLSISDVERSLNYQLESIIDNIDYRRNAVWSIFGRTEALCAASIVGATIITTHPRLGPPEITLVTRSSPDGYSLHFHGKPLGHETRWCPKAIEAAKPRLMQAEKFRKEGCQVIYTPWSHEGSVNVIYNYLPNLPQRHLGLSPVA